MREVDLQWRAIVPMTAARQRTAPSHRWLTVHWRDWRDVKPIAIQSYYEDVETTRDDQSTLFIYAEALLMYWFTEFKNESRSSTNLLL